MKKDAGLTRRIKHAIRDLERVVRDDEGPESVVQILTEHDVTPYELVRELPSGRQRVKYTSWRLKEDRIKITGGQRRDWSTHYRQALDAGLTESVVRQCLIQALSTSTENKFEEYALGWGFRAGIVKLGQSAPVKPKPVEPTPSQFDRRMIRLEGRVAALTAVIGELVSDEGEEAA